MSFLFEHRVPGVHILLQEADLNKQDVPRYFTPKTDSDRVAGRANQIFVSVGADESRNIKKNDVFLPPEGIETRFGLMQISSTPGRIFDQGKSSETREYLLTLTVGG